MYITVDLDTLNVVHKHPDDPWLLADLAWLELGEGGSYSIFPVENLQCLREFTDNELRDMYSAITQQEVPATLSKRVALVRVLVDLFDRLPATECNRFQLDRQCAYAEKHARPGKPFQFVGGASTPQPRGKHWEPGLHVKADADREAQAVKGTLPLPVVTPAAPKPKAPTAAPKRAQQRTQHNPFAKPQGKPKTPAAGVTAAPAGDVQAVGESVWQAAGKPTQKIGVLMLRQEIIKQLKQGGMEAQKAQAAASDYCANKIKVLAGA